MAIANRLGASMIALAIGMSGITIVAPKASASALDSNFKSPLQRIREVEAAERGSGFRKNSSRGDRDALNAQAGSRASSSPVRTISGPSYNTYRPDELVLIKFSDITDPVVTGSTSNLGLPALGFDAFAEGRTALTDLKVKALPEAAKAVGELYSTQPDYLWVSGSSLNSSARAVLEVLQKADEVGLSATDYEVAVPPDAYDITKSSERQRALMRFEMALSAAVANYVLDANRGRIDPNRISGYHDFNRKKPDLVAALKTISDASNASEVLAGYNPRGAHFKALAGELAKLRQADEEIQVHVAADLLLKPGGASPETKNLVAAIKLKSSDALKEKHGLLLSSYLGNDEYDSDIVALVKDFQREAGLSADGVVGPQTVRALVGETNQSKIDKVLASMERSRWLPGEFSPRRVFINQPAFTATYFENDKPAFETRVVVGKKSNQTNFFDDQIESVEYNPYWGVPQSIIVNEMLPKLRNDPSYLDRLGYEVSYKGRSVSSSAVNWSSIGRGTVGVRQPPGAKNALGKLKILFPNSHAIYMHDTPSKSLFNRDVRAFSHGCVRLQDPRGMAARVLGVSVADVDAGIAGGRNQAVPVTRKIPVHVSYFTAWPDADGKVEYFADIYDRDSYLKKAFEATHSTRLASI